MRLLASPLTQRASLREQAIDVIREAIVQGRLAPGTLVSEQMIANQVGVSRTPVREALLQLANEGLVEFVRNSGVRITTPNAEHLSSVFALRASIEGYCAQVLAAKSCRSAEVEKLRHSLGEQQVLIDRDDHAAWVDVNMSFHMLIVEMCGNPLMLQTLQSLRSHTLRIGFQILERMDERMQQSLSEHLLIVEAIEDGRTQMARQYVEDHMTATNVLTKALLEGTRAPG